MFALVLANSAQARQPQPITVQNLGLPVFEFGGNDKVCAFSVFEASHGAQDLNGDGDIGDTVLFVLDPMTGAVTNLGIALNSKIDVSGSSFAVHIDETQEGVDLNGDSDADDIQVIYWYDHSTGVLTNTQIAGSIADTDDTGVAMLASEPDSGLDLNGDGDTFDHVARWFDGPAGAVVGFGLASFETLHEGDFLAISVNESAQGMTDLNGDGDATDRVMHLAHLPSGNVVNTGLALFPFPYVPFQSDQGRLVIAVSEAAAGTDKNGDGDALDSILHVVDVATGAVQNYGLAVTEIFAWSRLRGHHLTILASESDQAADLNGDGDMLDDVAHYIDLNTGTITPIAAAYVAPLVSPGGRVALFVPEAKEGNTDKNGDGDTTDLVAHVFDPPSGVLTNLRSAAGFTNSGDVAISDDVLAYRVREFDQGFTDLNGDGDFGDLVLFVHDFATGKSRSTGLPAFVREPVHGHTVGMQVSESSHAGVDLNQDGDSSDTVVFVYDALSGTASNLGLAGSIFQLDSTTGWAPVSEAFQGAADLNGDQDAVDIVGHLVRNLPGACGTIATFGSACVGTLGTEPALTVNGCLAAGQSLFVTITHATPGGSAWIMAGLQQASVPLPPGCTLLIGAPLSSLLGPLPIYQHGGGSTTITTPPLPSGLTLTLQAFAVSGAGFSASGGVSLQAP